MVCHVCNEKSSLICSRCEVVAYCSQECQRKAWPTHKKTCVVRSASTVAGAQPAPVLTDAEQFASTIYKKCACINNIHAKLSGNIAIMAAYNPGHTVYVTIDESINELLTSDFLFAHITVSAQPETEYLEKIYVVYKLKNETYKMTTTTTAFYTDIKKSYERPAEPWMVFLNL